MNELLADLLFAILVIAISVVAAMTITKYAYGEPSEIIGNVIYNLKHEN